MNGKNKDLDKLDTGCLFADPTTLPGEYRPSNNIDIKKALAYAKKVKKDEKRNVTFEEMQRFVKR